MENEMAVTAAVKGGSADLWGATLTLIRGVSPIARYLARLTDRKELRKDRRLEITLLGVVPGSLATETLKRVQAVGGAEQGGKRTIETENLINRVTTAQDVTDINTRYNTYTSRPTYPVDKAKRF
jgi:hypothetical protein